MMARVVIKYDKNATSESIVNRSCCFVVLKTVGLISFYFTLSIGITFYQRWVMKELHFPLSLVTCHLALKFLFAWAFRVAWEWRTSQSRVLLEWGPYFRRVAPVGFASGLDVALSNWGLNLITVSLYTMTKTTVIVFILGFALLFKLEKKSWTLILIVTMISSGLFLFTYRATEFNSTGFLLVLVASFTSGLRWTLAQLIMQKSKLKLSNPLDMVYHVQPWMLVAVLPFAVGFEGKLVASSCLVFRYHDAHVLFNTMGKVLFGAVVAFFMETAEFLLVGQTSSLTLSVAGICKEVLTMVLAVEWAGDSMNTMKFFGLLLCLSGISYHAFQKALSSSRNDTSETDVTESIGLESVSDRFRTSSSELRVPLLSGSTEAQYLTELSEDGSDEDSSNVLFNVLQRRDNHR